MKDTNGFYLDVAQDESLTRDITGIRINVDDSDSAYGILTAHGFKNTRGVGTLGSKSSKEAAMVSPSGLTIALVKHIKEHE